MISNRSVQIGPPRFGIAVHALILLAKCEGPLSSAAIASNVQSHATFLRRVLAQLTHTGIVEAREGRNGGYYLKRRPDQITLADIFLAVKSDCCEQEVQEECTSGQQKLEAIMGEVQKQAVELLKQHTLADLMQE
ncbi:MAG: Rrf2 family transcriptional regulator [Paenibacillus macerans]|uniref:Rrf2 family protein n=1 Tax=Paenibacillus macerans TaxID=44252 RepID=A0A090XFM9_PAEMA|nr:Rrf2 family transcriptional regulator [Paenibacillus macerans]KFM83724.1 Rrf2 family protein [Paenibacillus macerans]MBS5910309.1 Rrf2 family transcriptional regulator [Paenibacillus macerans]MCY7559632.1 Rrf2 family transcriptional regulator [Paenibacillus macerans]MDU5946950.1 Rrf2 family transcriptional regulator [Paenibacillus macerans]MDU7471917.1 Rrf2 family transcriptional regulator [Paenibacillus macerans]